MSTPWRLTSFAIAVVAVFALAGVAGAALDLGDGVDTNDSGDQEMTMDAATATHDEIPSHAESAAALPGLAMAADGFRLELGRSALRPGRQGTLRYRIVDAAGETVEDFDVEHERRMHLIVVRRDLEGFQHLHPRQLPDGSWQTSLTVEQAGDYRVYADFVSDGESLTLASDLFVPGRFQPRTLPPQRPSASAGDGYRVAISDEGEGLLRFAVSHDGEPIDQLQPYLGADGHLVVLRQGDGAFLHAHPLGEPGGSGPIEFMVEYPSAGSYRLFLQFKHQSRVHTAEFTVVQGEHGHE